MAARPGRMFTELAIDAPYPRGGDFRTSTEYVALCRRTSEALGGAMAAGANVFNPQACTRERGEHSVDRDAAGCRFRIVHRGLGGGGLVLADQAVRAADTGLVAHTLVADWPLLSQSLLVTLITTVEGFVLASLGGFILAVLFDLSRYVEYSLYPYAVILQVTPVIAIAPLLLVYLAQPTAVLVCAWIVAFFPVLANTTLGLRSVDRNLLDLFALYGASPARVMWDLKLPAALPHVLAGLRIAGGLSLVGAVAAEIAAGSGGAGSGLAFRIMEAAIPFSISHALLPALLLLCVAGLVIFYLLALVDCLALSPLARKRARRERSASRHRQTHRQGARHVERFAPGAVRGSAGDQEVQSATMRG